MKKHLALLFFINQALPMELTPSPIRFHPLLPFTGRSVEELQSPTPTSPVQFYFAHEETKELPEIKWRLLEKFLRATTPGTEINRRRNLALTAAYSCENLTAAEILLTEGSTDPNFRSRAGFTPLLHLANTAPTSKENDQHYIAHVQRLIACGGDCGLKSSEGNTPLMCAVNNYNPYMIAALLGTYKKRRDQVLTEIRRQNREHNLLAKILKTAKQQQVQAKINSGIKEQLSAKNNGGQTALMLAIKTVSIPILSEIAKCLSYEEIIDTLEYAKKIGRVHRSVLIKALKEHPSILREAHNARNDELVTLLTKPTEDGDNVYDIQGT